MFSNSRTEKIMRMVSNSKVSDTGQVQEFPASQIETPVISFESSSVCDSYVIEIQGIPEVISETGQVQEFAAFQIDTPDNVCDSYTIELQGTPELASETGQVQEFPASQIDIPVISSVSSICDSRSEQLQGIPEVESETGQVQEFPASQIETPVIPSVSSACDSYIELQEITEVVDFTDLTILNTDNIDMNTNVVDEVLDSVQLDISSGIIDEAIHTVSTENSIESASQDASIDHTENSREEDERRVKKRNKKPVPESWEKNIAKKARMRGEKFVGYKRDQNKKITRIPDREERTMGPKCMSEKCKKINNRHCDVFTEQDRKMIFDHFWKILNWKEKEVFVSSLVDQVPAKKSSVEPGSSSRRSNSYVYCLKLKDEKKIVCKKMFLNTLGLNEWMAHNWIKRTREDIISMDIIEDSNDETPPLTHRNKRTRASQENSEREKNNKYLETFLDELPKLPSHYCRKRTSKLYLEPIFSSKKQLYELYVSKCNEDGVTAVCQTKFFVSFENLNLSLFQPRKDRCDTCCGYETKNITEEEWKLHIAKKNRAKLEKENDRKDAEQENCYLITMDLQAVKLSPLTKANAFYYKTKLCSHNFTVYNVKSHQCTTYWWNETQADLVASTFASCLIDYLQEHCLDVKRPVVIYSDGCTYQNRNITLSNALLHFSIKHNVTIEQKFLTKGHTTMECDSVHACIERKVKNKDIFVPAGYITASKEARKKPFPYEVKYLTYDFFKNYTTKDLQYYDSLRPGKKTGDSVVVDIVSLKYENGITLYKLNFDDDYQHLPRRPSKVRNDAEPPALYQGPIPIPLSKWKHLQELKKVIPTDFHSFYDNLPHKLTDNEKRKKK